MEDLLARISSDLAARVSGPMSLRLLLQPAMATAFAIVAGLKDARTGKPPYFWALATDPGHRADMLRDGWKSVGKVFVIAILLDVIYQFIVQRFVYPGEAILVAVILAIVPYLLFRGPINRLAAGR
jgi:hypothetical protein